MQNVQTIPVLGIRCT